MSFNSWLLSLSSRSCIPEYTLLYPPWRPPTSLSPAYIASSVPSALPSTPSHPPSPKHVNVLPTLPPPLARPTSTPDAPITTTTAERDPPSSSPFKHSWRGSRRARGAAGARVGTTYGSRRAGAGAPLASTSGAYDHANCSTSSAWRSDRDDGPDLFGTSKPHLRARLDRTFNIFPAARAAEQELVVARALHLLRAFENVLEAVYAGRRSRGRAVPSLMETCARGIGAEIEENARLWLGGGEREDGPDELRMEDDRDWAQDPISQAVGGGEDPDSSMSSDEASAMVEPTPERTRDEQDQERTKVQDEWYEACPPYCARWILAEHATSIVLEGLEAAEVPYGLVECAFDVCLTWGAASEAARFHPLLLSLALYSPPSASASLIPLLRRTPSPLSLLGSLHATLLTSSFADRLFFHPSLTLSSSFTAHHDPERRIGLVETLLEVAALMVRSIVSSLEDEHEGERDVEGARKLVNEVLDRVLRQIGAPSAAAAAKVVGKGKGKGPVRRGVLGTLLDSEEEGIVQGLWEVWRAARGLEELCGEEEERRDEMEEDEEEQELSQLAQLASIVALLDVARLTRSAHPPAVERLVAVAPSLSSSYLTAVVSSHLLADSAYSPEALLGACEGLDGVEEAVLRALLSKENGGGEVGRRLRAIEERLRGEQEVECGREVDHDPGRDEYDESSSLVLRQRKRPNSVASTVAGSASSRPLSRATSSSSSTDSLTSSRRSPHRTSRPPRPRLRLPSSSPSEVSDDHQDAEIVVFSPSPSVSPSPSPPLPPSSASLPLPLPRVHSSRPISSEGHDELDLLPRRPSKPRKRTTRPSPLPQAEAPPSPPPDLSSSSEDDDDPARLSKRPKVSRAHSTRLPCPCPAPKPKPRSKPEPSSRPRPAARRPRVYAPSKAFDFARSSSSSAGSQRAVSVSTPERGSRRRGAEAEDEGEGEGSSEDELAL
ncbi:hypothetical protein JCM1840_005111 [Sporobolomyces johnsonii]